jgi:hypothetical protein
MHAAPLAPARPHAVHAATRRRTNAGPHTARRAFALLVIAALSVAASASCTAAPAPAPRFAPDPAPMSAADFDRDAAARGWPVRERWFARVPTACAQVVVLRVKTKGFRWGESFDVHLRSDHRVGGAIEITGPGSTRNDGFSSDGGFTGGPGDPGDDARCRPAPGATPPSSTGRAPAPPTSGSGTPPTTEPGIPPIPPIPALPEIPEIPEIELLIDGSLAGDARPSKQISIVTVTHQNVRTAVPELPPAPAGTVITFKFWAARSIDWTSVTFEVIHAEYVPPDPAKHAALVRDDIAGRPGRARASEEFQTQWRAHFEDCRKRQSDADCADTRPASKGASPPYAESPPPPAPKADPPPPRPSDGAVWIGGHWAWDGFRWSFWSPGFWRVPDDDRKGKHTPTAPGAPPAAKQETPGTPPTAATVWTPGYWHWSVSAWIWIDGAWRLPPAAGVVWRPFVWRVEASGGVRLDPGGWSAP